MSYGLTWHNNTTFCDVFLSITVLDIEISYDIDLSQNIKFQRPPKRAVNGNNNALLGNGLSRNRATLSGSS